MPTQLEVINTAFLSWIREQMEQASSGDLTDACEDYINHAKRLRTSANGPVPAAAAAPSSAASLSAAPPLSALLGGSSPGFSFGSTPASQAVPSSGFGFGVGPTNSAAGTGAFVFPQSSAAAGALPAASAPGFSSLFGQPPASGQQNGGKFSFGVPPQQNGGLGFGSPGSGAPAAAPSAGTPAEGEAEDENAPKEVTGEVVIDGSSELLFKAVGVLSVQHEGAWQSRGQGLLTLRRDTSQGVTAATSFVAFTTEAGRSLLRAALTADSDPKQLGQRATTRAMRLNFDSRWQTVALRLKSKEDADSFTTLVLQHRPKAQEQ